jgi:drug/metabolite transporter (DMT)-like permease
MLAYFLLGEVLTRRQGIGAALIVVAGVLLSVSRQGGKRQFKGRLLTLMLICSFIFALNIVVFKMFALRDDFWTTVFWQGTGQVIFGIAVMFVARERRRFIAMLKANTAAVLVVNTVNEVLYLTGNMGAGYAVLFAPVAVVQAVSSTTTLFVFVFGIILTLVMPRFGREDLSRANLWRKGVAIALVTVGAYLAGGN